LIVQHGVLHAAAWRRFLEFGRWRSGILPRAMALGNIGATASGLSALALAAGALIRGPAIVRAWIDRQRAEADQPGSRTRLSLLTWASMRPAHIR